MLAANSTLKELDLSDNQSPPGDMSARDGPGFAQELAVGIKDNGALSILSLENNSLGVDGGTALAECLKGNSVLIELNIANNNLVDYGQDMSGVIAIANVIKDMGAMTSLHVGMNHIPEKEMTEIIALAMGKESMKLLCEVPIKDKSLTELDVSSKSLGIEGALVVAEYLRDNGAMTSLNLASNYLCAAGAKVIAEAIKVITCAIAVVLAPFS
jgi:Ran GTPase-activating protein (RanGAP) involved in mRNA processing and transport